ncbi:MAG: S9 family peptidase [Gemmatimonadetes bacterium]|nr:S9 family peptidase [Gemmatimonadota bacterium]
MRKPQHTVLRRARLVAPALAGAFVLLTAAGTAQGIRPMTAVDLINIPRVIDPQLSADGRQIAFTFLESDWKLGRRVPQVWRVDADGTSLRQLTSSEGGASTARWSPSGSTLAVLAQAGGRMQIHLLAADGGEPKPLSDHPTTPSSPTWAPDGRALYFLAPDAPTPDQLERERVRDDVFAFDETFSQVHLWRVAVDDGRETRLTSGDYSVLGFSVAPDGRRLVINRAPSPQPDDAALSEVWIIDADGRNPVQVTDNRTREAESSLAPDNSQLLFLAEVNAAFESYYQSNVFLVPATGGPPRLVLPDFPHEVVRASWAPDSRAILIVANMGVHSEIFRVDLATATATQLTDGRHAIEQWSVAGGGRQIFLVDEPTRFGDVWTLAPDPGARPVRVTGIYDYLARDFSLPRQQTIHWKGDDGVTIEGILHYPLDYRPEQRYPLVVQVHGGPTESDRYSFGPFIWRNYQQLLTARGYAVLWPNHRGSTGYGNVFLRDMVGGYFRHAHLDVLAGVDAVVAMGVADPDRLAVMGWSAGGHMTNKLITVTDRFKAASSGAGAANWISMYAQTDVRTDRDLWFGGSPWQRDSVIDRYWEHSPLKDVASARTPTLFFVGQNDPRVPLSQSIEMFRALRSHGVPTHLYVAPREGHAWGELRHQLFKMNAEMEWFERYTSGRAYAWEPAPQS